MGSGWANNTVPRIRFLDDDYFTMGGTSTTALTFRRNPYAPQLGWSGGVGSNQRVADGTGEKVVTDEKGNQYAFFDNTGTVNLRGQLKRVVDHSGEAMEVTGYTANGQIEGLQRVSGGAAESWVYTYGTGPVWSNYLIGVTHRLSADGGTTWRNVRSVEYRYNEWTGPESPACTMKAAIVRDGGLAGTVLESKYYRYYAGDEADGYRFGLKYQFGSDSFDRLASAYGVTIDTADTLTDAQVAPYADSYFRYGAFNRVTYQLLRGAGCSSCSGG